MRNIGIIETTQHVYDGIRLANISQKFVTEPFAPGRTLDQTGNVDDLDGRRYDFLRIVDPCKRNNPVVRER